METLNDFMQKINDISEIVNSVGASGTNGINTLSNRIDTLKNKIEANDFTYTNFHAIFDKENRHYYEEKEIKKLETNFQTFLNNLPEIKSKLNFNLMESFNLIFQKDDFVEQWNTLNDEQKESVLFLDKEMYKIIRQKIDVSEFDFLFKSDDKFDGSYPEDIFEWIHAPANSRVVFYKLRKNAKDGIHEDFFNSEDVKQAEIKDSAIREQIAVNYLANKKKLKDSDSCWYDRLDMLINRNAFFHYRYHFFKDLEDEFNGYKEVKNNIKLPDILKKWSGKMLDETLYGQEMEMFNKELEGKNWQEKNEIYKACHDKYPTLKIAESLQGELKKEEFKSLVEESKGTEFEEFFNNPMTEKMRHDMPYRRTDYMFVYFREKFTNDVKRKPKLK